METSSALLAICAGNSPASGEFPAQRPVTRSFGVFIDLCLNKGWENNREAGDLRRYRAHYDVIVMAREYLLNVLLWPWYIPFDMSTKIETVSVVYDCAKFRHI